MKKNEANNPCESVTYRNRYNDEFNFDLLENGNIQWSGEFEYVGVHYVNDPDNITGVDPSGGPFIEIGTDMSIMLMEGTVTGFIKNKNGYELIIEKNG
jgi:hypothetical protein